MLGLRRFLYLDFDGVLHPADVWLVPGEGFRLGPGLGEHALFEHAGLLQCLLEPQKDVGLVLSTSWVPGIGLEQAVARLPAALARRVVGATFDPSRHGRAFSSVARGYQVLEHAQRHGISDWAALDDDARGWPEEEMRRLVQTDPVRGLGDESARAALLAWLNRS